MFSLKSSISRRTLLALTGAVVGGAILPASAAAAKTYITHTAGSFALFYKPRRTGLIWDTWMYHHEGTFYLYYNPSPIRKELGGWDCVALATSRDGVHWNEHGIVIEASEGVSLLGSGAVWPAQDSGGKGKFIMNFSEWRGSLETGSSQGIHFAESHDLIHWRRLDSKYDLYQDPRWYEPRGRWDNLWPVPRPGGGYYGYWAASPKDKRVGLGFGESHDGITWRALEPALLPEAESGFAFVHSPEVGAVYLWRKRYYALVGLNGTQPTVVKVNDQMAFRPCQSTYVSDAPSGPFFLAKKNPRLLVGNASYFARFADTPDGVLLNHHSWEVDHATGAIDPDQSYMTPIKRAQWDDEGTLRLVWWERNDQAKKKELQIPIVEQSPDSRPALLETIFDRNKILIVEGEMPVPDSEKVEPAGLYLQGTGDAGTAFLVRGNAAVEYGSMLADGTRFEKHDRVDRDLKVDGSARFRLIRRGRITEFYLNDYLMQCYCLPEQGTGRIGFIGPAHYFRNIKAWYCA